MKGFKVVQNISSPSPKLLGAIWSTDAAKTDNSAHTIPICCPNI
jgi:hypothetical protein